MSEITTKHKRFNLWLPIELWEQLERFIQRKQRSHKDTDADLKITPQTEIRRAVRQYLSNGAK